MSKLGWGIIFLCLSGCAENPKVSLLKPASFESANLLQAWQFQGRLLIRDTEALTANIDWQHTVDKDILKLSGTLGLGAIKLELTKDCIVIERGFNDVQSSCDIDAFVAQSVGFVVPVTALRAWVVGNYLQGVPVLLAEKGFQQLNWHIVYKDYMQSSSGTLMPRKLTVKKNNIILKLVIDKWDVKQ